MSCFANVPLNYWKTWQAIFGLYKKSFSYIWFIAAVIGIAVFVATLGNYLFLHLQNNKVWVIVIGILALINLLLIFYISGVALYRIYQVGAKNITSLHDAFVYVLKLYPTLFASILLVFLTCLVGTLLLFFPGLFLFVLLLMVQPLVIVEKQKTFAAFKESAILVWGNWWRCFVVIFPLLLVNYLINLLIHFSYKYGMWYIGIGDLILGLCFYPLFYCAVLVLYNDLKLRQK